MHSLGPSFQKFDFFAMIGVFFPFQLMERVLAEIRKISRRFISYFVFRVLFNKVEQKELYVQIYFVSLLKFCDIFFFQF